MKLIAFFAAFAYQAAAISVSGAAEGFAKGVTGGGSASPLYPQSTSELVSYLGDNKPRVIVLTKTFDFRGTEGTATSSGCAPWGTSSKCQIAIEKNDWCKNDVPAGTLTIPSIKYDKAGVLGITVASHKTLIGQGSAGVIKGKGLRIVGGASNVIIQNIAVTDINPQYVWGGDAITVDNSDMVWIDHVTTARIGRQHIVLGTSASKRVTISNSFIDGRSNWSASCNGYHYWGIYLDGSNDYVTMKGNYIYHTSGRSPKVQGNTLLHAVNNYWYDNGGHAFEIGSGGYVLAEGNVFQNVPNINDVTMKGKLFTAPSPGAAQACSSTLGRPCQMNGYGSSGPFSGSDTSFFSKFRGQNIASASPYTSVVASVNAKAGQGKL
ncbi:putative pectin lyase [Penicillium oxalicum 114-2]|uniref:pectin lyase n=1 Tax=Penicillium oxalicum (strain 114-2 / CGMCC 5302) TaxID=933388 RepID=S7Z7I1_PENO1|nr:putative pectin lyase [Penicillium oxalicum 114-2]